MRPQADGHPALAIELARRLAGVPGVIGVMLGGSHARGTADARSDIDLGLFYLPADPPAPDTLRELALAFGASSATITEHGEWGPWIEGGGWLQFGERRVDWLYRDLERIESVVEDCRSGLIVSAYQPGHPHGFHSQIHFGEVAVGTILHDPSGRLAGLQARTRPYPAALRRAIVERFGWQARFALELAPKAAARGDVAYVSGCLFVSVGCLLQVLYALNERPFVNEKGALREAATFEKVPARLRERVEHAVGLGSRPAGADKALAAMSGLIAEVDALTG